MDAALQHGWLCAAAVTQLDDWKYIKMTAEADMCPNSTIGF